MNMNEYLIESERTTAKDPLKFSPEFIKNEHELLYTLNELQFISSTADLVKRSLFYKDPKIDERQANNVGKLHRLNALLDTLKDIEFTQSEIDIIHAGLGIISEGGEIIERVLQVKSEKRNLTDSDQLNLVEEGGDVLWYTALLLRVVGVSFEDTAGKNISKLRERYKEKFTSAEALNRNLDKEVTALES